MAEGWPEAELLCSSRRVVLPAAGEKWIVFDPFKDDWAALGRCDVLLNCIGAIDQKSDYEAVHVGLAERLLAAREKMGHPRIVQVSALGARPDHPVAFLSSKGRADELLLAAEGVAVVRPSIVCTPGTMLWKKLDSLLNLSRYTLGKIFVPEGFLQTRIQPIMPLDLGALLLSLLREKDCGVFEAVGPEPLSFQDLILLMWQKDKVPPRLVELPREFIDGFVKYFISIWFPKQINYEQFSLLFMDNLPAKNHSLKNLISTKSFWQSGEIKKS